MGTLLEAATANNAKIGAQIAEAQAALHGLGASIAQAVMATPGVPEAIAASLVRDAQAGGKPVSLRTLDSVLANSGLDISQRFREKEIMVKAGMVRG